MRIAGVKTHIVDTLIPEEHRVRSGAGYKLRRQAAFVELTTDDGLAGYGHTCVRLDLDDIRCFGWNDVGQLGDGTTVSRSRPVKTRFGGPIVRFRFHANARRALKGGGHRFELTTVSGTGRPASCSNAVV